jgi:preprotein translocase subunit YajC
VQDLGAVLPFIGIALLFWLLIIRPASKRQKAMASMQSQLGVGDEIVLTSGIYGTVASIDDAGIHVIVADGVTIRVARGAVGSVVPAGTPDDDDPVADATEES